MRDEMRLPDLTFPGYEQGRNETPLDLKRLLYHGGASMPIRQASASILAGELGLPLPERIEVVRRAHEAISGKLASGGSQATTKTQIRNLITFVGWVESAGLDLNLETVQTNYVHWTDMLQHRLKVAKAIKPHTAYTLSRSVGQILDHVVGRETPMIELTRVREPKGRKTPQGRVADKQNLEATFAFGRLMQDICDGLTLDVIWGARPFRIPLRAGGELVQNAGLHAPKAAVERTAFLESSRLAKRALRHAAYESNKSPEARRHILNLRILAELLMFIGQTGMNLSQAYQLELRHFSYASDLDGYKVRDYKARRGGEVLFDIFKEYRNHFERYLDWRRKIFPAEIRLFPLIRYRGTHESSRPSFLPIQQACKDAGVAWLPPSSLRSTRVNWLLRRSGDTDLTAEMAQHQRETLLHVYERPSQQRAIGEVTRFWRTADPALCKSSPLQAAAPGACDGTPSMVLFKPVAATAPDCIHPSGCLWCEHHRDIDSLDYVWALACFRYLKSLELSRYRPPQGAQHSEHPAYHAVMRMSNKLAWFRDSNNARRAWVEEACARIDEGNYHPEWRRLIEAVEGEPV
ncbi:site-specific integrase [Duganella vulcania]|uniref:Site-specific integrase n=1 Tax=Duganella vulcania TaxID=2692166 RepID=A0A845GU53_9BURK|nr:site-specific integrase [Duganella vulcania]MYM96872.1 site-specific integrase [Duganella vulcania]